MQSGQVNASQLLGAFLGSVKEKLGKAITKNDFSGELKKHLSRQVKAGEMPELEEAGAVKTDQSAAGSKASATGAAVSSEAKTAATALGQDKGLTASSAKIKEIKSKAKTERSLFLSNPAIIETILAKLHYPANIRDQCAELLNKQGYISIQALESILGTRPDTVSGAATGVPSASVRTLLKTIVQVSGNEEGKGAAVGKSFKSSVAIRPNGSYTRDELRELLEKVVQGSQKSSSQTQSEPASSSSSSTVTTKTAESLKTAQAEELVSTVLPSFISAGRKDGAQKVLAGAVVGKGRESQNADGKRADLREKMGKALSDGSSSQGRVSHEKPGSSTGDGQRIAPGTEAMAPGGENGPSKDSAGGAAPAQQVQTDTAAALGVAAELAHWIKAAGALTQSVPDASAATPRGDSLKDVESRAALGGQDTPMLGKDIEKLTGGKDQPSENGVLQAAGAKPEDNLITLPQMNNSGGDGFVFYDRNRMAELAHDAHGAKTTGASGTGPSDKNIATVLASYISADDESGSQAQILSGEHDNQKSDAPGVNKKDSGGTLVKDISKDAESGEQPGSDKAAPVGREGGVGRSVESGISGAGKGSSTTAVADSLTAGDQSVLEGQGGGAAAKQIAGSAAGKDSSPGPAAVGASTSSFQAMNMNPADTLAQSGIAPYAPCGAVQMNSKDLAQNSVEDVSKSAKPDGRAGSDKAAPVGGGDATGRSVGAGINGAVNGSSNASASAWSLSQQEAISMPGGVMDQGAQSGEGQSSGASLEKNATQSVSATTGADRLTAIEQSVVGRQAFSVAAKRIDEPTAHKDAPAASALLQASPSNFQTVNMHPADNSAQNAFTLYDPYRAVELANNMREQAGSGAGRRLVLDMDSEGLGKINLKVEARKGEISVAALTQNEPARQALMSHTVELRQDLRNQGLVLGKFMVDVNGGKQGRESGSGASQSGGKGRGAFKETKAGAAKKSEAPIPATAGGKLSQISIFA